MSELAVSVCTPMHNEEHNVAELIERVRAALLPLCGENFEHIIVDDGSSDRSADVVRACAEQHATVRLMQHERNQGERAAWKTAFDSARGKVAVMIACDLQSHPEDIPRLLAEIWERDFDVATGARTERKDGPFYWAATRILTTYMRVAFDVTITDVSSSFFAVRTAFVRDAPLENNDHRYIMAVIRRRGGRISEIGTSHSPRTAGTSHYSRWKVLKAIPEVFFFTYRLHRGEFDQAASEGY